MTDKSWSHWTDEDLEILRISFPNSTLWELFALLNGRHSRRGIANQAFRRGLVKTDEHRSRVAKRNVRWNQMRPV